MPTAIWLNGEFTERDAARVSALDAGLQHGVGLFETMHATDGRVFRVFEHLARLQRSARELGLSDSLRINPLAEAVRRTVERAAEPRTRVRLTITGGDLSAIAGPSGGSAPNARHSEAAWRGTGKEGETRHSEAAWRGTGKEGETRHSEAAWRGTGKGEPTILIVAQKSVDYPAELFERGVTAVIADTRISAGDPMAGHKTLNYWWRLRELALAGAKGAAECLLFDTTNRLASGMVSNVFVVKDGVVTTPPARGDEEAGASPAAVGAEEAAAQAAGPAAPRPVLPGITRRAVMGLLEGRGAEVRAAALTIHDVLSADEVFLTNSGWGVLPVVKVEAERVGQGAPGPVARACRAEWLGAIREELNG